MADETRIVVRPNGPYLVEGPLTVVDTEGREYKSDRPRIALCRCGNSANKPFCDGTHQRIGFDAPSAAPGA
ncbi:MAG TPA: CDGSH iron-sulfur domain-containing protein [Dehalococcoidia bacterium]|nr:CDGSH iron-sulfur domain-containing protein [Dehalococcoidia bacterium]